MRHLTVHKANFFHPEARAIHCLSYDEPSLRLAVARSDYSIEIWDLKSKPFVEKVLSGGNNSVEDITWCDGQLFSAGLHSCIIKYDLQSVKGKSVAHTGNGIWCLQANESISMLAAGTEDGCVCIYKVDKHGLDLKKTLGKQEGRILCLAWHGSGNYVATGSIDTIRIWDVDRDQVCERITVGRKHENIETIVWCIGMTWDFTIISGDSSGRTSFWDGKTGTLLKSTGSHKGDVLALCLSKDEKVVYTAGIDPLIVMHERVEGKHELKNRWIKSVQNQVHSHDVRALNLCGSYLVSGGIDSYLVFSKYPPRTRIEYSPYSELLYSAVASEKKFLLLRYPKQLELWKFEEPSISGDEIGFASDEESVRPPPIKLLSLRPKYDETVVCSSISNDGKWICFSTTSEVRLFFVTEGDDELAASFSVQKVPLPEALASSRCLAFISSSRLIISSDCGFCILSCEIPSRKLMSYDALSCGVSLLAVSHCTVYLACGCDTGTVFVYDLENSQVHAKLPTHKYQPTAISFDQSSANLVVVYSDRKVVNYNLKSKVCTDCCLYNSIIELQNYNSYPIRGVLFPHLDRTFVIFYDEFNLYVVEEPVKEREHARKMHEETSDCPPLRVIKNYKHLLGLHQFSDGEMLAVEVKSSIIKNNLPAPLWRKHYGT